MAKKPEDLTVGDKFKVIYIGGASKFFQITGMDDILYRDIHDDLATDSTESFTAVTALNPPIDQIYWIFEIEVDGNISLFIKQPAATNRWGTNTSPQGGFIFDLFSPPIDMWIAEDYPPNTQIVNSTNVTITPVLWWIGKRFAIREIVQDDARRLAETKEYTTVKIGGLPE